MASKVACSLCPSLEYGRAGIGATHKVDRRTFTKHIFGKRLLALNIHRFLNHQPLYLYSQALDGYNVYAPPHVVYHKRPDEEIESLTNKVKDSKSGSPGESEPWYGAVIEDCHRVHGYANKHRGQPVMEQLMAKLVEPFGQEVLNDVKKYYNIRKKITEKSQRVEDKMLKIVAGYAKGRVGVVGLELALGEGEGAPSKQKGKKVVEKRSDVAPIKAKPKGKSKAKGRVRLNIQEGRCCISVPIEMLMVFQQSTTWRWILMVSISRFMIVSSG